MSNNQQNIWIVFSGETEIFWLKWLLKRDFRHCYAIINDGSRWITYDPLAHKTEIEVQYQLPSEFDLPEWLRGRGLKVLKIPYVRFIEKPLPPALFTCVEAIKRLVGVRSWFVWTPYQLFRALETRR